MRLLRVLMAATAFAALLAAPSAAQEGRPFHDAWFWGVKGGVLNYSSNGGTDNAGAPMVGVEWLITRTRGGLYISGDQSFLSSVGYLTDEPVGTDPLASIKNVRRLSMIAMVFPAQRPTTHPYIGLGASLYQIGDSQLLSTFAIPSLYVRAADSIQAKKVTIAPMVVAGVQQRLPMFSVFAQYTGTWLQKGYLLRYTRPKRFITHSIEGGIRYNFGSSIDRQR